ncbi:MAG: acyltransferase family protein, partial [Herbiconiux sp.]|nr:acyltransferase family protein [Herbiconiux sp.]
MSAADRPPATLAPHRRPALDGLRGLAALWVLVYHAWIRTGSGTLDGLGPLAPVIRQGTLGVEVFFVLSGCVLALGLLDPSRARPAITWWPFVVRRAARLLPAVWVALAVAVATAGLHQASTDAMRRSITPESVVANAALLAGVARLVPGYEGAVGFVVDPVVWSLTPEMLFSLLLVPVLPLVRRRPLVVIGLLVAAGIALRLGDPSLRVLSVASPLLTGFPLGLAAALAIGRWGPSGRAATLL